MCSTEKKTDTRGPDVSGFVQMLVLEASRKDVEKAYLQNNLTLSSEECRRLIHIMDTPMEFNFDLQQAFERLEEIESTF